MNLLIAPAEAPIGPPRGEKFSGLGMETDNAFALRNHAKARSFRPRNRVPVLLICWSIKAPPAKYAGRLRPFRIKRPTVTEALRPSAPPVAPWRGAGAGGASEIIS